MLSADSMRELPRPTAVYVIAVTAAGAAVLSRAVLRLPLSSALPVEVALFLLLGLIAEFKYVNLGHRATYSVSTAVNFAAAIIFGPSIAVLVSATGSAAADVWRRMPLYKVAFNTALLALSVAAGATAMEAARAAPKSAPVPADLLAFTLYALVNTAVNYVLLCTVIGLETRVWPWQVARQNFEGVSLPIVALYPLGVLMAVAYHYFGGWLGLLLLAVPVVAVYNSLDTMAAREAVQRRLVVQAEELARRDAEAAALRELDRSKNEFISTVSHELRTPLTIVHCYADLLQTQLNTLPAERVATAAKDMFDSAVQLSRLIDDLLDFARAEQGMLSIYRQDLDLAPVLHQVAAGYRRHAGGDRLVVDVPVRLPAHADGGRVTQVVSNLIENALKYSPGGPVALRARLGDGTDDSAGQIRIEVEDHGPGINPEEQQRVWEKFFRGREVAAASPVRGMGVGLAVVRTLVEAHGGQVGLESAPGQGACFWFTLPAAAATGVGTHAVAAQADRRHVGTKSEGAALAGIHVRAAAPGAGTVPATVGG
jgi:signal transduction histidine kinase